jgi:DNA-binding NarL/FixJ family response regulator
MSKIRVLLADDHIVVRQGLRALLAAEEDIEIVGEADNGRQAVQLARKILPDVAVIDIAMPVLNGLEATRQITQSLPNTKVLILSSYSDDDYVQQLTEAGAAGYLVKQTPFLAPPSPNGSVIDAGRPLSVDNRSKNAVIT